MKGLGKEEFNHMYPWKVLYGRITELLVLISCHKNENGNKKFARKVKYMQSSDRKQFKKFLLIIKSEHEMGRCSQLYSRRARGKAGSEELTG